MPDRTTRSGHPIVAYDGRYDQIAELFTRSVHELACTAYSPEQLHAWAPRPVDPVAWKARCEQKRPWLSLVDQQLAGFIELDDDGHIDCHYVHPQFSRRGVATALLNHVIDIANDRKLPRLYVEASHLIKPVYERNQFRVIGPNSVMRHGVVLQNWIMERELVFR